MRYDPGRVDSQPTGVANYASALQAELRSRCELVRLQRPRGRGVSGAFWHLAQAAAAARDRGCVYLSTESLIVPVLLGRRAAVTVHDLTPLTLPDRHARRSRLFQRALLRLAVRRVGLALVPSAAVRDDLLRWAPRAAGKVAVVPEAPRFPCADPAVGQERRPTVVYAGTVEPRKNVLALTRAFLAGTSEPWQLVLLGRLGWLAEPERAELQQLCANPRVSWLGYVSDAELRRQLSLAGLFAYVSESEGFGLPPLEAMALGAPVLISDAPALVEVAAEAAAVVHRGADFETRLASALRSLTTDEQARAELAQRGLDRAREFSWSRSAELTVQALRGLCR